MEGEEEVKKEVKNERIRKIYYKKNKFYIKYFDANNLYGQAMSYKLPYAGYRWLNEK